MPSRPRRPKASDIFRESNFLFAKKASFAEAFPDVAAITVEVDEYGSGTKNYLSAPTRRVYSSVGEFVDCSNPHCYGGGISVGNLVREIVRKRKTEGETSGGCRGHEGSARGRRLSRPCINTFKVKVTLVYRADSNAQADKGDQ
jgi:hypothetical protein